MNDKKYLIFLKSSQKANNRRNLHTLPPPSCFIPEAEFPLRLLALEQPYEDYDMDWYGLSKDHNKRCLRMKIHKKWNKNPSQTMLAPKHRAEAKGAVVVINLSQLVWISIFHKSHLKWKYWNNWNGRWGRVHPWTMTDLFLSAKQKKSKLISITWLVYLNRKFDKINAFVISSFTSKLPTSFIKIIVLITNILTILNFSYNITFSLSKYTTKK